MQSDYHNMRANGRQKGAERMIRNFTVSIDDSLRNAEQDIDELERKWGAEEVKHTCLSCKHYLPGEYDGSCGSYICKTYSNLESKEEKNMKVVLDKGAYEPIRAHDTDAGLDLRTPIEFTIRPHDSCVIDTGVHIELPRGTFGQLFSKSGLNVKRSIVSLGGTIDEGYTGSITVKLYNEGDEEYHFRPGDKIVQLVIMPYLAPEIEYVNELGNTDRGDNGFGSTGK